jgi:hypothetical protein
MHVRNNIVVNVVEYPTTPPLVSDEGDDIVRDPTDTTAVGSAFDMTDTRKERELDRMDGLSSVVIKELLRLTNADRAQDVPPKAPLTGPQYRAFLKTII